MPDLGKLPVPQYASGQPYHYEYDNLPLKTLEDRDNLINAAVDRHEIILENTAGTQGTLSNRLNQFVDANGDLHNYAVDQAQHNIAEHTDGSKTVTSGEVAVYQALGFPALANPVPFVRMLEAERTKLSQMSDYATNLMIDVNTYVPSAIPSAIPSTITFGDVNGLLPVMTLERSDTIEWTFEAPNKVKADLRLSTAFAHRHFYDLTPISITTTEYKVNSIASPYIADSLRVYINGVRLSSTTMVYYPNNDGSIWTANSFTPDEPNGKFTLSSSLNTGDVLKIDFDLSVTT